MTGKKEKGKGGEGEREGKCKRREKQRKKKGGKKKKIVKKNASIYRAPE